MDQFGRRYNSSQLASPVKFEDGMLVVRPTTTASFDSYRTGPRISDTFLRHRTSWRSKRKEKEPDSRPISGPRSPSNRSKATSRCPSLDGTPWGNGHDARSGSLVLLSSLPSPPSVSGEWEEGQTNERYSMSQRSLRRM